MRIQETQKEVRKGEKKDHGKSMVRKQKIR